MRSGCAIVTRIYLYGSYRNEYKPLYLFIGSVRNIVPGRDTYQLTSCNGLVFPPNNTRLGRVPVHPLHHTGGTWRWVSCSIFILTFLTILLYTSYRHERMSNLMKV